MGENDYWLLIYKRFNTVVFSSRKYWSKPLLPAGDDSLDPRHSMMAGANMIMVCDIHYVYSFCLRMKKQPAADHAH